MVFDPFLSSCPSAQSSIEDNVFEMVMVEKFKLLVSPGSRVSQNTKGISVISYSQAHTSSRTAHSQMGLGEDEAAKPMGELACRRHPRRPRLRTCTNRTDCKLKWLDWYK